MKNIPEKINLFNVYKEDGGKMIGITEEVTLPDFEAMSEEISGPGILGTIDAPTIGHYGSQALTIPFRLLDENPFELLSPTETIGLTLRGSQQLLDGEGRVVYKGMRVVVRGRSKSLTAGTVKQGAAMGSSVTLELTYIMIEVDRQVMVELDKLNSVFIVNGTDLLAQARALC